MQDVQDHESCQPTRDALVMLKLVAMGETDVANDRSTQQGKMFRSLKQRLKQRIAQDVRARRSM